MKTSLPKQLLILLIVFCFLAAMGPKYRQAVSAQDKSDEPPDNAAAPEQNGTFSNPAPITIPGAGGTLASTINVSGMPGTITKITVTLNGVNHARPDDLDILVEAPSGGRNLIVMSDSGGTNALTGQTLTFSDTGAAALPDESAIGAGTYLPTNYGTGDTFTGFFGTPQSPAPAGTQTFVSQFNGVNPNGLWNLFIQNDNPGIGGTISGGWSITIQTNQSVVNAIDDVVDPAGCTAAHCSLREAVSDTVSGGTITFAPALAGQVITLAGEISIIDKNLTIDASALPSRVVVSGNQAGRVFVVASAVVVINNLTVANGRGDSAGGGIFVNGSSSNLTLNNVLVRNNIVVGSASGSTFALGGGIFNTGTLTLNNCIVRDNFATANFTNNFARGGGIYTAANIQTIISNTRIHNNSLVGSSNRKQGAGIYLGPYEGASVTVINSSIDNNTTDDSGGGIFADISPLGSFSLVNSTVYQNSAARGGGIAANIGSTLIVNSTVTGNTASESAGGIRNTDIAQIRNSVVAGNTAPVSPDSQTFTSLGNNLIGNTSGSGTVFQPTDITNPSSTGLGTFGDYGGATPTIPLMVGSPAINAGSNCVLTNDCADGVNLGFNLTTDQRGPGFPRRHGLTLVDIGAYETAVPTAAEVGIGGRVVNAEGRGISRAYIILMDASGAARMALTNPFGYFRFDGLPAGETYVLTVRNKRYRFEPQTVNAFDDVFDLQIVALPPGP